MLLGSEKVDQHRMYIIKTTSHLVFVDEGIEVPVVRSFGNKCYEWAADVAFSFPDLRKIRQHFFHAKPKRLFNMRKRADVKDVKTETLKQLQGVLTCCDICQRHLK